MFFGVWLAVIWVVYEKKATVKFMMKGKGNIEESLPIMRGLVSLVSWAITIVLKGDRREQLTLGIAKCNVLTSND